MSYSKSIIKFLTSRGYPLLPGMIQMRSQHFWLSHYYYFSLFIFLLFFSFYINSVQFSLNSLALPSHNFAVLSVWSKLGSIMARGRCPVTTRLLWMQHHHEQEHQHHITSKTDDDAEIVLGPPKWKILSGFTLAKIHFGQCPVWPIL